MALFENFISYRRTVSAPEVKILYDALRAKGLSVFCDVYSMGACDFNKELEDTIKHCSNFILVIGNESLLRCENSDDWLRREIRFALKQNKQIICVFTSHDFSFPKYMPEDIEDIRNKNGLYIDVIHIENYIDRLISNFLISEEFQTISDDANDFIIEDNKLIKYAGTAPIVKIPNNIEVIGANAFRNQTKVIKVEFPDNITTIEESAFERCISLKYITLPSSLTYLGSKAFCRCYSLGNVDFNSELRTICEESFCYCGQLKQVCLGASVLNIHPSAFNYCGQLMDIEVSKENKNYYSSCGLLYDYSQETLIRCPEGHNDDVIALPLQIKNIGSWAFFRCSKIVDIKLPHGIVAIGENAFRDCCNIQSLTLVDTIQKFPISAIDGWNSRQRIVMGKRFSPRLKYVIEKKINEMSRVNEIQMDYKFCLIKTAFESMDEAISVAKMLLDSSLIVSGQIKRMRSIYVWEDEYSNEIEYELTCFTESCLYKEVEKYIDEHHSYEQCELICIPIINTSESFGNWISKYTAKIKIID